jgi:hypothetical protein
MEPVISDSSNRESTGAPPTGIEADFAPLDTAPTESDTSEVDEYLRESVKAEKAYATAVRVAESGNERQTVAQLLLAAKQAEMAREWHLAAISLHAMADIFRKNGPERNLARAFRMFRRAIAAYEQCGHFDEANNLEYQVCIIKLRHARELGFSLRLRIEMFLYWATAGFGYRPLRVLASGVVLILIFAVIYWITGGIITPDEDPVTDFNSAAYFSGTTFLTINYGDLLPAQHVRWVTVVEGLTGLTTISFFVVILANRLRH